MTVDLDALEALARAASPDDWLNPALADVRRWLYTITHGVETTYVNSRGEVYGGLCWKADVVMDSDRARADVQGPYIAAASPDVVLALIARIRQLEQSNATKATRIAELLAAMVRITNETPFPDEMARWTEQRAALVAEVGTLKARVRALSSIGDDMSEMLIEHAGDSPGSLGTARTMADILARAKAEP